MEGQLAGAQARLAVECGVVTDGKIITGRAAGNAYDFAAELIEVLLDRAAADKVLEAICY